MDLPAGTYTPEVAASLAASSRRLRDLAATLSHGRAGWCNDGLEYMLGNDFVPGDHCSVSGFAENDLVSFTVELRPPHGTLSWEVDAAISARRDQIVDCGMHCIKEREAAGLTSPADAIATLDELTGWLAERAAEVPAAQWRDLDPGCCRP